SSTEWYRSRPGLTWCAIRDFLFWHLPDAQRLGNSLDRIAGELRERRQTCPSDYESTIIS
ncbi:MAG: hypothetical protein SV429_08135, partial [Pseudomonadota bacterium]|nr:hypothetical protein [Pseudomonadota bacterium]